MKIIVDHRAVEIQFLHHLDKKDKLMVFFLEQMEIGFSELIGTLGQWKERDAY